MQSKEELLQELRALQAKCTELMNKIEQIDEPKLERVPINENYFSIFINYTGTSVYSAKENHDNVDDAHFDNNNYFKTAKRAQEVGDKINFLLKLERFHDTFCPDHVPDWKTCIGLWSVYFNHFSNVYDYCVTLRSQNEQQVYFPTEEIAQKVCDILNKERENNDKS